MPGMADMDAAAKRYEALGEDAPLVPNTVGLTTAEAAAAQAKWGKNEIPEEKEPLWKLFAMQFVGTLPAMARSAFAPPRPRPPVAMHAIPLFVRPNLRTNVHTRPPRAD